MLFGISKNMSPPRSSTGMSLAQEVVRSLGQSAKLQTSVPKTSRGSNLQRHVPACASHGQTFLEAASVTFRKDIDRQIAGLAIPVGLLST